MSEHKTREKKHAMTIYWDDAKIEQEMELLPTELREPYQWLKKYVRDECNRDVDVLVSQAKPLGVVIDKTNWTRILKGRLQHDADGNLQSSPCVAHNNLLQSIKSVRDKVRIEFLRGTMPHVETTTFHAVRRHIEKAMRKNRVNRWRGIVGPTGTQKTTTYKELAMRNPLIKWLESADNGSIKEFVKRLAVKCGVSKNTSYSEARARIFESMMTHNGNVKCIIIDNIQRMMRRGKKLVFETGKTTEDILDFLAALSDETNCAIVWSITPEDEPGMFKPNDIYMEQFEGRAGGAGSFLRLSNFPPKDDVIAIAETLGLKDARKHADALHEIAKKRGRIRFFFEVMQEAKNEADGDEEPLTMEYIEWALSEATAPEPKEEVKP